MDIINNDTILLPPEHMHKLTDEMLPSMTYDGKSDFFAWRKSAREKLWELLGIGKLEKFRTSPRMKIEYDRICEDMDCREIRFGFFSEENVYVPCHLLVPKDAKAPLPVMICLQGHSKGMHISLGRPKYPGDEVSISGGDRDFARRTVKEGFAAIALEQRCFGEAGGSAQGPGCRMPALRAILIGRTLVGERVWDVMRLIDLLESEFSDIVDVERIGCLGNSGGGTTTVYASALEDRIKVGVPSCGVSRFADSISGMLHCECNYVPHIAEYFDMGDLCAMAAPKKMIVVSGERDPIFPLDGAKKCVEVAKTAYSAAGVPDGIEHIIGNGEHRFYADDSWGSIRKALLG